MTTPYVELTEDEASMVLSIAASHGCPWCQLSAAGHRILPRYHAPDAMFDAWEPMPMAPEAARLDGLAAHIRVVPPRRRRR